MIYLIVGVDQEGDPCWDVTTTLQQARDVKAQMDETAFDPMRIYSLTPAGPIIQTEEVT